MKDFGKKTNQLAMVRRLGLINSSMMVITLLERKMDLDICTWKISSLSVVIFQRTLLRDKENILGKINLIIMAIGKTTKCMVKVNTDGMMDLGIEECMLMVSEKVMASILGQMVVSTRDTGRKERDMELVNTHNMERGNTRNGGKMASCLSL